MIFFLCVGEKGTYQKWIPCPKWHCAHPYLHITIVSMESFVSKMQSLFQQWAGLGFVSCCLLGDKQTPRMLSNTITNSGIQNLWAKALLSPWPLDRSGLHFKPLYFYLKKESSSVPYQPAHFQGVTHRAHKHWVTRWSTLQDTTLGNHI